MYTQPYRSLCQVFVAFMCRKVSAPSHKQTLNNLIFKKNKINILFMQSLNRGSKLYHRLCNTVRNLTTGPQSTLCNTALWWITLFMVGERTRFRTICFSIKLALYLHMLPTRDQNSLNYSTICVIRKQVCLHFLDFQLHFICGWFIFE